MGKGVVEEEGGRKKNEIENKGGLAFLRV